MTDRSAAYQARAAAAARSRTIALLPRLTVVAIMWLVMVFPVLPVLPGPAGPPRPPRPGAAGPSVVRAVSVPPNAAGGWRSVVRNRVSGRVVAASLALGFLLGTLLTAATWTVLGAQQPGPPRDVQLVIPRGTAAEIARGEPTVIPSEIRLTQGDRLIIANQDVVDHTIGGWQVAAGMTLTILADVPASSIYACTIHPSGNLGLIIGARPGLTEAILLTCLVSIPIGLVLAAGWTLFRALDDSSALDDVEGQAPS